MSKEEKSKKSNQRLWLIALTVLLILVILIAAILLRKKKDADQTGSMTALLTDYLSSEEANTELDFLSSLSDEDTEKLILAVVRTLDQLQENGTLSELNRDEVLSALQTSMTNLGLGLNEQQIKTLSERLLDHYLENSSATYKSTKEISSTIQTMEDTMTTQMREDLTTISEYLSQLDTTVVNNQEQLALINSTQEENLQQIHKYVSALDKDVMTMKEQLSTFEERYAQDIAANNVSLTGLSSKIGDTQTLINTTKQQITSLLNELESSNQDRFEDTRNQLNEVEKNLSSLDKHLGEVYDSLDDTLEDFQKKMEDTMEDHQKELLSDLQETKDFLKSTMDDNIETVHSLVSSLSAMIDENFAKTQEQIRSDVAGLQAKMDSIHSQIVTTQAEITELLGILDANADLRQEEMLANITQVNASIQEVNAALAQINSDMDSAHEELKALMIKLQESEDANHAQLLSLLGSMEQDMADQAGENLNRIMDSFNSLSSFFSSETEKLQNMVTALGTDVENQLNTMNSNVDSRFSSLTNDMSSSFQSMQSKNEEHYQSLSSALTQNFSSITNNLNGSNDELKAYLEEMQNSLDGSLQSVFTSVSSGKQLLASALLTKGVTINEDATFLQIRDAILAVPQQLLIGVQQVPGEISYDYHYHTDADGNRVGEVKTNDRQGGCYTVPVYHTHGDSCYSWSHEHTSNCKSHPIWVDWVSEPYWGLAYDCGNQPANVRGSLICTLPTSSDGKPIYYQLGCGLSDGQITGAHIIYNQGSTATAAAVYEAAPEAEIRAESVIKESLYPPRYPGTVPEQPVDESEGPAETITEEASASETAKETDSEAEEAKTSTAESESSAEGSDTEEADAEPEETTESADTLGHADRIQTVSSEAADIDTAPADTSEELSSESVPETIEPQDETISSPAA